MKDYQVVIIDNASEVWHDPTVQNLFIKTVALKLEGYKGKYPEGILPIDTTEFVGMHFLLCRKEDLTPVMGFRSITLERCKKHFLTFPALSLATLSHAPQVAEVVKDVISRCETTGVRLIYNGGWTISPELRRDPEQRETLKEMMMAFDFLAHHEGPKPYEVLGAGVVHLKTDEFFNKYGYKPLTRNGVALPLVNSHYLGGVEVRFIHVEEYNLLARSLGKKYENLWNQRIVFSKQASQKEKKAA